MTNPPIEFDENGRDPSGFALCAVCAYPYRTPACDNPGCRSNRSAEQNAREDAETARRKAEDAERARFAKIRREAMRRRPTGA